jgi:hypothetical protein
MQVKVSALLLEKEEAQEAAATAEAYIVDLKVRGREGREGGREEGKARKVVMDQDRTNTHSLYTVTLPPSLPSSLGLCRPASGSHRRAEEEQGGPGGGAEGDGGKEKREGGREGGKKNTQFIDYLLPPPSLPPSLFPSLRPPPRPRTPSCWP